ncbi:MAG TPA: glycosyltransferase family 87 protein [Blastocatellia bacterium]|nr:glycosyltransferase family 87 protein [Blastocatellia bacterium]
MSLTNTSSLKLSSTEHSRPQELKIAVLAVLGAVLITLNVLWLYFPDHARVTYFFWFFNIQTLAYLAACALVIRYEPNRHSFILILVIAAILRFSLLPTIPAHSTDIYRYVWEGLVQTKGVNPYRYVPAAPELAHLRDSYVYENINRKDYARSPYPPVAQLIFATSAFIRPYGVTTLKVFFFLFECVTIAALILLLMKLGMNPARIVVYAWSPLAIWEGAQNGHIDIVAVTFISLAALAAAYNRRTTTGVLVACAAMVKIFPAMLAVAFYKRWDFKLPTAMLTTLALFCIPYFVFGRVTIGHISQYPSEEGFLSGERFILLKWIHKVMWMHPYTYMGMFAVILSAACLYLLFREKDIFAQLRGCTLLAGLTLLFISPQYGWYYLWLLPLLSVTIEDVPPLQFASAALIAYSYIRYHLAQKLTPDLLLAPIISGLSLYQFPSVQWFWLLLISSAAFLSWI